MSAREMTMGTKIPEIRSAKRCMGALSSWASRTMRTIWARSASLPTLVARTVSTPVLLIAAPITPSPSALSTGRDSPVTRDSSTDDAPSTTTPSTGIVSPGLMRTTSPALTAEEGTSLSSPSVTSRALSAWSPASFLRASPAFPRALDSRYLPSLMKVINMAEVSKKFTPWLPNAPKKASRE